MAKLTPKMDRFCLEYVVDFNATQAAIRAGYAPYSAGVHASRMLKKANIQAKIIELRTETRNNLNVTKENILGILMETIGARLEDITDAETGAVLPPSEWPPHMKRAVSSLESDEVEADGRLISMKRKVKLGDRNKAIEILNRMLGYNMPDKIAPVTPEGDALPALPVINVITALPKQADNV